MLCLLSDSDFIWGVPEKEKCPGEHRRSPWASVWTGLDREASGKSAGGEPAARTPSSRGQHHLAVVAIPAQSPVDENFTEKVPTSKRRYPTVIIVVQRVNKLSHFYVKFSGQESQWKSFCLQESKISIFQSQSSVECLGRLALSGNGMNLCLLPSFL